MAVGDAKSRDNCEKISEISISLIEFTVMAETIGTPEIFLDNQEFLPENY